MNVNDTTHYKGGNSENVALVIKSTEKEDIGNYSCQLSNNIGKGTSDQKINLDVQCKIIYKCAQIFYKILTCLKSLFQMLQLLKF